VIIIIGTIFGIEVSCYLLSLAIGGGLYLIFGRLFKQIKLLSEDSRLFEKLINYSSALCGLFITIFFS
jgi:hypothetical protein